MNSTKSSKVTDIDQINNEKREDDWVSASISNYVLVKFATKKTLKHYVGQIVSLEEGNKYLVKFLRRKPPRYHFIIFPDVDDVALVPTGDVIKLPESIQCRGTARINRKYSFSVDFSVFPIN